MLQVVVDGAARSNQPLNLLCGPEFSIACERSQDEKDLQTDIIPRLQPCVYRLII